MLSIQIYYRAVLTITTISQDYTLKFYLFAKAVNIFIFVQNSKSIAKLKRPGSRQVIK